ncbi:MAG TPA: 16S rRNA (cytosine(1402)-N(4))-methyltransferase RsmH [Acidimicrobiales bacterium]|nr:16S rRNA (cytosine(1402)-N(4))-methyltransferase RsmH [Acidimicrobiales bacterium]
MAPDNYHVPVLADRIVEIFTGLEAGVVVDATLGGGGHAAAILTANGRVRLVGIDRDPAARAAAAQRLRAMGDRVVIVDATFGDLARVLAEQAQFVGSDPIVGVLMDLGVSSHQLDDGSRGFSFRVDAPLDMRMDTTRGVTAAQFLAQVDEHELTRLLRENGEDRFARAIARALLEDQPSTTFELNAAVERAVPAAARRRGHVATRVYQALRVAVNEEQRQLEDGLAAALDVVAVGGVVAVISYHSGEDRLVKSLFHEATTGGCHCPPELGCVCGAVHRYRVAKASAILARPEEVALNPRARSARLRVAYRVLP